MHAHAHESAGYARNIPFVHFKSAERRQNRLQYRAHVAALCDELARANLSATAMRVALNTLARMIRRGSSTEAMPVAAVAEQLGVHRNAVSAAYSGLESAGLVKRIAVKHRGAPTRTRLTGAAALLVDGKTPGSPESSTGPDRPLGGDGADIRPSGGHGGVDSMAGHPEVCAAPSFPAAGSCTVQYSIPEAHHEVLPEAPDATSAQPAQPVRAESPKDGTEGKAAPFLFDKAINDSMAAKVPSEARMRAMQAKSYADVPLDLAWGLTDREVEHFRALFPKEEKPAPRRAVAHARQAKLTASPDLAAALTQSLQRLQAITGSKAQAFALSDQIAYQVATKGLGQGNVLAGVRAGVRLVESKRWSEPRGWSSDRSEWSGITLRSLLGATAHREGHAHPIVH
ncbi:hypothetical protein RHOFW510R12_01030 [Rhodanobacter sp. FW510-R12]|uniref:hypothetical protein n=1 Tax=Rhodanobacter thiooxydans TaxID=416169 RepID=UPI00091EA4F4|nr:hypothetical protein [Rhodanobacter thiooxydans]UJJ56678.1 hypothetical protein LRK53_18895 [Rhodanobacter thiooxydans]